MRKKSGIRTEIGSNGKGYGNRNWIRKYDRNQDNKLKRENMKLGTGVRKCYMT